MKKSENNKESFFSRHFKKKRVSCEICKNDIDAYLDKCPYCASERNVDVLDKKYLRMTLLSDYKELCFFFIGTLGLAFISFLFQTGLNNFPIKQKELVDSIVNLLSYIIVAALFFCVLSHDTRKTVTSFKKQAKSPLTWIFVGCGLALIIAFSFAYRAILDANKVVISETANQQLVNNMVKKFPAIAFFFIVLLGPIIEEYTYRVGLFSFFRKRNRYLAYFIAVILFALVHFIPSFISDPKLMASEAYNIPLYIFPSLILTITYEYCGVSASIYTHILNNLLSFILVLVL